MSRDYLYIQIIVFKKTLKGISLDFQRGLHKEGKKQDPSEMAITLMENKGETGNETTEKSRKKKLRGDPLIK
ncbi:hypothetical protein NUSPORA_00975 [Nucleospora cyclopteri]